jgi:hypothetical protein
LTGECIAQLGQRLHALKRQGDAPPLLIRKGMQKPFVATTSFHDLLIIPRKEGSADALFWIGFRDCLLRLVNHDKYPNPIQRTTKLELLFSAEQGKLSLGSLPAIGDQSNREEHQPANHPAQIGGLEFLTNNLGDCNIGHFHPDLTCDYYSTHTGGVKPDTKAGSQKLLEGIAITSCDLKHNPEIEEIVLSNFSV